MLRPTDILYGILLPFAIALIAFAIAWRPWQKRDVLPARWRFIARVGLLMAFVATYLMLQGIVPRPVRFPPRDSTHWLLFFTPIIALAVVLDSTVQAKGWLRLIGALIVSVGLIGLLLWKPSVSSTWLALAIGATAIGVVAAEHASQRIGGIAMPIVLTTFTGMSAIVIGTSGSQKLSLVAGALAAASGASVLIALWRGRAFTLARGGGAIVIVLLIAGLLFCGKFFARVDPMHLWPLLATPVLAAALTFIPIKRHWLRTALIVVLSAVPAVVAGIHSAIRFREEAAEFLM